jgi:hypothetical protein
MKDLKKLLKGGDGMNKEMMSKMKMDALARLSDEMSEMSGSSIMEKALKPKASVTVATDDPKKLPEALEKAEDMLEESDLMEGMEESEESEEQDDMDLDNMTPEQLKEELKKLKMKLK